jgi:hypothetical protein
MDIPDWKKFEELAASIQSELAPEARVTSNARLKGKSGVTRQVDVLIEQPSGQFDLRIVVDCKDYKAPVDINDVETFLGLSSDVGANKGAMVAANGFTTAAKERALGAGVDLFRLVDTAEHKWRSYVTIPAVLRDYQIDFFTFTIRWTGRGILDREDFRYMPILRSDGSFVDYACNLVADRWDDGTIPEAVGEHRDIALTFEPIFLSGPSGHFPATVLLNVRVKEVIYFGQLPLQEARGFKSELSDVTHMKSFTTAPLNPEKISREWQHIDSIENLAVKPVITLTVKSVYPRYKPETSLRPGVIGSLQSNERSTQNLDQQV